MKILNSLFALLLLAAGTAHAQADLEITDFDVYPYVEPGSQVSVKVWLKNSGTTTMGKVNFTLSDGTNEYSRDYTVGIGPNETRLLSLIHKAKVETEGVTTVTVTANLEGDDKPENNTLSMNLYGIANPPTNVVLFEEGTGTWCGWCPRGSYNMKQLADKYPVNTALVAVHNGDPMVVSAYNSWMSTQISGYPSGVINRGGDVDPGNFVSQYPLFVNKIIPINITPSATFITTTNELKINTVVSSVVPLSEENIKVVGIVIEDGVTGSGGGYAQANYYSGGGQGAMGGYESLPNPVPASQMVYDDVARALLTPATGELAGLPATFTPNEEYTISHSYTVPASYNVENLEVIIVLLDENNQVIGTGKTNAIATGINKQIGNAKFFLGVQNNPFSETLNVNILSPSNDVANIEIIDNMGKTVYQEIKTITTGDNTVKLQNVNISAGMYTLRVNMAENGTKAQRVMAQ